MKNATKKLNYLAPGLLLLILALYFFAYQNEEINWFVNIFILVSLPVILFLFNFNKLEKNNAKDFSQWYLLAILIATALLYLPSIANGFSNWDDPKYVLSNPLIRSFSVENLKAIFAAPFKGIYQPLSIVSLTIDYSTAGLNAPHYHISNIILHVLNTFLVFSILIKIVEKKKIALIATALFGLHPVQVESVVWITERKNVLFALFYLMSLLQYLKYCETKKAGSLLWSLFLFALSLLAKPQGVMLAPVLFLIDYVLKRKISIKKQITEKAGFFLFSLAAGLLVIYFSEGRTKEISGFQQIVFAGFAFSKYIYQTIVPVNLSAIYPYPNELLIIHYLGFVFFLSVLLAGIWLIKKNRSIAFGLWFFVLNIFLLIGFISINYFFMADRYNYIPSIGLFIMLAGLFSVMREKCQSKNMIRYLLSLFALILIISSTLRIQVWSKDISLWNDVLEKYPNQAEALNNRGFAWYFKNEPQKAIDDYNKAIKIDPGFSTSYVNRGTLLMKNNQYETALKDFNKALELFPEHATAYINRAIILNRQGKKQEALSDFNLAIRYDPVMEEAYISRGALYNEIGEFEKSIADYNRAIEINPQNPMTWSNRGLSFARSGNEQTALADFNRCIEIDPDFVDAYSNRGFVRYKLGHYNEAIMDFTYAIKLRPKFATAYMNRGLTYIELGKTNLACPDFQYALQLGLKVARKQLDKHCTIK
ncbi:MAG: tetratricopeptide repeat protein [Bacteroidota bacterium]|nr:tetratricopeptide repeat protein [Bacteroidota bacterium]